MKLSWLHLVLLVLLFGLAAVPSRAQSAALTPPVVNPPAPTTSKVVNFTDYKVTNGQTNTDWKAMVLALEACAKTHAAVLNIPTGAYTFADPKILSPSASGGHIQLTNLSNLTINGNGSTFLFHYLRDGFDFTNCHRVLLTHLTVLWDFDIAGLGTVQLRNGKTVIAVNPAYPITASTPVDAVSEYDTAHLKWLMTPGQKEVYNPASVTLIAPQTLFSPDFASFPIGDQVVVRYDTYAVVGFQFGYSPNSDLTFDHITTENCPGMVFQGLGADRGFAFNSCVIRRRNPARDPVSTGADGIHVGMTHGDTIIENCDFSYLGDDSVNLKSVWLQIVAKTNRTQARFSVDFDDSSFVQPGDVFQFLNEANLAPLGTAVVSAVQFDSANSIFMITFTQPLPAAATIGSYAANLTRASNRATLNNNSFHDQRARGMLIQSQQVAVTNNRIQNVMGAAIQLTADVDAWHEGYGCVNDLVTNNWCDGCNGCLWGGFANLPGICGGVINIFCQVPAGLDDYPVHHNLTLANNTINNTPNLAFFIGSAKNVSIIGNVIENCPPSATTGIYLSGASAISITKNKAINSSLTPGHGIYVDPATTSGITLSGNTGF